MKQLLVIALLSCAIPGYSHAEGNEAFSLRETLCMIFVAAPKRTLKKTVKATSSAIHELGQDLKDVSTQFKDTFK
jgi:hypothetical protein